MKSLYVPVIASGDAGFLHYLNEIKKIPSLEAEEEYMLAKRMIEYKDMAAAHKLVLSHLKLVAKVASTFKNYGLPIVELVSEGNIGLMQAVKKFNPEKGFRLSTYAIWWIKAAIQEYIVKSWSLVKIGTTAVQKKLFFNLGKIKRRIQNFNNRDFSTSDFKDAAQALDVTEENIAEMNLRMGSDYSLDQTLGEDELTGLDLLQEGSESQEVMLANNQEVVYKQQLFEKALKTLTEREQLIISERRLKEEPTTLDELSTLLNISKERVRQIEARALEKMQQFVKLYQYNN